MTKSAEMEGRRVLFSTEFQVVVPTTVSEEEYQRLDDDLFVPLEDAADEAFYEFQKKVKELDPRLRLIVNGRELHPFTYPY